MTNWVRDYMERNPELNSLAVHKRARHGLHLRRPSGLIEAHFTGKPCHYLDQSAGWLPIDTALLLRGDNSYGAPGVPVTISTEGAVSIDGGTYSQKTSRVGLFTPSNRQFSSKFTVPLGSLSDDSLIADGTIGGAAWQRVLRLTEDGIREELTLGSLPTGLGAGATDWLVLETVLSGVSFPDGWLDEFSADGMHFPLPHAWDAVGSAPECRRYARTTGGVQRLYTGIPVSWLASAVYPITIDPDFAGSTADCRVYGSDPTYATARSTSTDYNDSLTTLAVGQIPQNGYVVNRAFLLFPTSTIGADSTVSQANLKLTAITDNSVTDFDLQIVKQDWSAQNPIGPSGQEAAFDNCLSGTADDNIWRNSSGLSVNTQYTSGNLSTAWIAKTGTTYYSLRSARDYAGITPTVEERLFMASANNATTDYRPVLTVLYSAASATFLPNIMRHFFIPSIGGQ